MCNKNQQSTHMGYSKQKAKCGCLTTKREKVGTPQLKKRKVVTKNNIKLICSTKRLQKWMFPNFQERIFATFLGKSFPRPSFYLPLMQQKRKLTPIFELETKTSVHKQRNLLKAPQRHCIYTLSEEKQLFACLPEHHHH